jgi:hypothetical protein
MTNDFTCPLWLMNEMCHIINTSCPKHYRSQRFVQNDFKAISDFSPLWLKYQS